MEWKDVGRAVAKASPALGAALGGPAGAALGSIIAAAFATDGSPDAVAAAVAATPDAPIRLREIELRHSEVISTLAAQQYQASLTDVQQARTTHQGHWMPAALTIGLAAMVMGLVAALFLVETPPDNKEVVYLIAGQLIGAFATAVAYWLGSSRGSVEKQAAMMGIGAR